MAQAAAPHMREAGKQESETEGGAHPRCIINVASTTGAGTGPQGLVLVWARPVWRRHRGSARHQAATVLRRVLLVLGC